MLINDIYTDGIASGWKVIDGATLTAPTTGASITTRVSLTTIAMATTAAPAGLAAATTCPTSWTLAPAHMPNCRSVRPSGPASSGRAIRAIVPKRVTIAIAAVTSSSSPPAVSSMAAIAEALVATAVGLLVAIPAVAMYNVFQRQAKSILANTEALSRVLLAHLVAVDAGTIDFGRSSRPAARSAARDERGRGDADEDEG